MSKATDPLDEFFGLIAAKSELDALLRDKTPDEQRDVIVGVVCSAVAELARQVDGLTTLLQMTVDVASTLDRRVKALEDKGKNVRGPFIRRGRRE